MYKVYSDFEYEDLKGIHNTKELVRRCSFGEKLIIIDHGQKTYGKKKPVVRDILCVYCHENCVNKWTRTFIKIETKAEKDFFNELMVKKLLFGFPISIKYDYLWQRFELYIDYNLSEEVYIHLARECFSNE